MTIVQAIKSLAEYLQGRLAEDKYYLQYKSTTNPEEFEAAVPSIYCFTMPSSAIIDTYPAKCPCICITLDGRDDTSYSITLHLCISSASVSDQEMATLVEGQTNLYNVGEGENYNTDSDTDLLIEGILFTDQIFNYVSNFTLLALDEISVEYPSVDLPDFPYAVSSVSFKMSVNLSRVGQDPYNSLY